MRLKLIGAAIDQCAGIPGAADAPAMLNTKLHGHSMEVNPIISYTEGRANISALGEYYTNLATIVKTSLENKELPLVIGGDHSCAIGTWSGVSGFLAEQNKVLGLIWIDAHMDSHTPESSLSGNIHGMPVATLLGYGYDEFINIINTNPKLDPKNIIMIGIRSYEDAEEQLLKKLGVKIYYNYDVTKLGFATVFSDAWKTLESQVDRIGLSIDVDGFDPEFTPGVGTTVPDGVNFRQFMSEYKQINTDKLLAVEITETNPHLDQDNKTIGCVLDIINTTKILIT